ncbi:T9SS type A sorting domain-containing protein [bacterium]|nr:T9SS type A sorting domain-containing protein [bacterium]
MSGGSWGHRAGDPPGSSPVHMCGWSKMQLDWADVQIVEQRMEGVEIPPVVGSNIVYRLWTDGDENSREYFLVENRRHIGFDASLTTRQIRGGFAAPEGLLITHIDDNLGRNDDELHRLVDIVEASPIYIDNSPLENLDGGLDNRGERNLYNNHRGDDGDLYPGFSEHNEDSTEWTGDRDRDRFGSFTTPSSFGYNGSPSFVDIYDITLQDENVICSFSITATEQPFPIVSEYHISDEDGGNNNGSIEPGETIDLFIVIENVGDQAAVDVAVTLEYEGDYIEIIEGEYHIGGIAPGESTPLRSPFVFEVSDDAPNMLDLEFTIRLTLEEYEFFYPLNLQIRPPHEWFKHPDNPVLTGSPDSWDADGILASAVLVEDDTLKCWYVGSAVDSNEVNYGSVGYAWSIDGGLNWTKHPEPVLTPDPDLDWMWSINGLGIMRLEEIYMMSFIATDEDYVCNIGLATSRDGLDWSYGEEPILRSGDGWMTEFFQLGQLSIFPFGNLCGIAFAGINEMGLSSIGAAFSDDLETWTIDNNMVIDPTFNENDFDAYSMISPDVKIVDQSVQILYAGVGQDMVFRLGSLFTDDGENINRHVGPEANGSILEPGGDGGWGETNLYGGRMFEWGDETRMLFNGVSDDYGALGLALQYPILSAERELEPLTIMPNLIHLEPAFPNPFNSSTTIKYHLNQPGMVEIVIFDITGREVAKLSEGFRLAGKHTVTWSGKSKSGETIASGVYILRVNSLGETQNVKLLLIK